MNIMLCAGLTACAAGSAVGQPEVLGTWLWDVTTQNGDAIVEPGETAIFTLSMDFSPDVGKSGLTGEIQGLAYVEFDTIGGNNATLGHIEGWQVLNNLDLLGDSTTTDGVSLFGTVASQLQPFNILPDDPIDVLSVEWEPTIFAVYDVSYQADTLQFQVWEGDAKSLRAVEWPVSEGTILIHVIPSPGATTMLAFIAVSFRRPTR